MPNYDDPNEREYTSQILQHPRANGQDANPPPRKATPYVAPDPNAIPPRAWLYGGHYMRGIVSATVAPGGFGKTTLALHEALTMAGRNLRVWYVSAEDDRNEIDRRIAAYLKHHNVSPSLLTDRLFIDDKMSFALKVATSARNLVAFDEQTIGAFENAIALDHIDVVILDPFVSFHAVNENDTGAMDAVVKRLGDIAIRQKCNIELSHHVRKPPNTGQFEITVYDARGAGAIVNAVRSCRVLNHMPKEVAQQNNIADRDRSRFIRIDNGKSNMAPPEVAKWMELQNIQIANGDRVQALDNYTITVQIITTDEDKAWLRTVLAVGVHRVSSQADEWLGHTMAGHYDRNVNLDGDRAWLNKSIKEWEALNWIKKEKRVCSDYKSRDCWVTGDVLRAPQPSPAAEQRAAHQAQIHLLGFQILGPDPDGHCEQCAGNGDVYLIRDHHGVQSHALHQECAPFFYRRNE